MTPDSVAGLNRFVAQRTVDKRTTLLRVIQDAEYRPERLTVAGAAKAAGVSRSFIYAHRDLLERLREVAELQDVARRRFGEDLNVAIDGRGITRSLLAKKVTEQRDRISELQLKTVGLEAGRARDLGVQLAQLDLPGRARMQSALEELERARTDRSSLESELRQSNALVSRLQDELAAVRHLLARDQGGQPLQGRHALD